MKSKKIVVKLKNLYKDDPVDRLRGLDIYKKLKEKGYCIELYNMQKDIDILINLDDTTRVKKLFDKKEIKIKKIIFDIQDDHFTYNKTSMKIIKKHIVRSSALERLKKINRKNIEEKIINKLISFLDKYLFKYYVQKADCVITSSYSLEELVKVYNTNVTCIPDSIDFSLYKNKKNDYSSQVSIVWIGTEGNIPYLYLIDGVLKKLQEKYNIRVKLISSRNIFHNPYSKQFIEKFSFDFDFIEWNKNTFGEELSKADIGIAPLPHGITKSSNKILSYMATGLPVVCSGAYDYKKFSDQVYIANNNNEWETFLTKLILDKDLRLQKGKLCHEKAKEFSLENIITQYEILFEMLFNKKTQC